MTNFSISPFRWNRSCVRQWTLRCKAVLPTLRYPAIWACFFVKLRFFLKTCGLLVFGLVLIEICFFFADFCFADCFFFKFYGTFAVSIYCWKHIGRVFVKICSFWACFLVLPPCCFIWFSCWFFVLLNFPANVFWACFWWNYLFLACFSNSHASFCKITWHHCCKAVRERSILLVGNCNVKIWCFLMLKKATSDVNDTGPSGNSGSFSTFNNSTVLLQMREPLWQELNCERITIYCTLPTRCSRWYCALELLCNDCLY